MRRLHSLFLSLFCKPTAHAHVVLTALFAFSVMAAAPPIYGAPISITEAFHFEDNVSANSAFAGFGDRFSLGARAFPNGFGGTTVTASQGVAVDVPIPFVGTTAAPNQFFGSYSADTGRALGLTGSWDLTFTNNVGTSDTAMRTTPTLAGAVTVPFANTVTVSGSGNEPTFAWTVPNTFMPDAAYIQVWDLEKSSSFPGTKDIIFVQGLAANATSFTVDPTQLPLVATDPDGTAHSYSLQITLVQLRNPSAGLNNTNILSQSRSFFDFTLLPPGSPPQVLLPSVCSTNTAAYCFYDASVMAGEIIYIDPLVSIGYDYMTGTGNPNFASVLPPTGIGDSLYDLWLWNSTNWFDTGIDLIGGQQFFFDLLGVDRFRILGIEPSAGVDPNNPTAFITGLSFTADGAFTGSMTPLTIDSAVPEPASLGLFGTGLALLGLTLRRKRVRLVRLEVK